MKRIIAISALTAVACVGFGSVAHAQVSATSSQTATVAPTCSITSGAPGNFAVTTQNINGVDFPVSLASTTGFFGTLCNTATSNITIEKDAATTMPSGQTPVATYTLGGDASLYPGVLNVSTPLTTPINSAAKHNYSASAGDIRVKVNVAAPTNKILQDGTYTVVLKATLTP